MAEPVRPGTDGNEGSKCKARIDSTMSVPGRTRTRLLAGTAMGVYLLVVAGATASIADAARACDVWPVCGGSLADPRYLVAIGHRGLAAAVGVLVLGTAIVVLRSGATRRVRAAVALAVALYPVQVAFGAMLATTGGSGPFPGLHLTVGLAIFGLAVLALAWDLEVLTGDPDDTPEITLEPPEPVPDAPAESAYSDVGFRERTLAYIRLTKPRLMWLLCLVAAAAMALAAAVASLDLAIETIVLTLGGGVLAIGASGTFNHVIERDRDRRMERTADRPLATHSVPAGRAAAFGAVLAFLSLLAFLQVNPLAAALGLVAILFYSVVYTVILKPNTVQNTVIGGAAGSLPALIGWAAVTGDIALPGLVLAGVIFVWTPAHFYNLALAYRDDYERGGFPMMPVVRGETETHKHILLWLGATLAASAALVWLTPLAWVAAGASVLLGGVFLAAVVQLHRERTERAAFRAFHASNAYLGCFLLAVVVDSLAV
jgi:protoheme IX farnesyltransferase